MIDVLMKRVNSDTDTCNRGKKMWRYREKMMSTRQRESPQEKPTLPTLISDFQAPGLWHYKCLWYFVPVTLANEYIIPLLMDTDSSQSFLRRDNLERISCTHLCRYWLLRGNHTWLFYLHSRRHLIFAVVTLPFFHWTTEIPPASQVFPPWNRTTFETFLYLLLHSNLQDPMYAPPQL